MENEYDIKVKAEKKEGLLEHLCGWGLSIGLAGFHSVKMYQLMDQAGMYEPSYHVPASIVWAATLGTMSLFLGGLYVGSKLPKWIPRLIKGYFNTSRE
jgi:hypothetical protein